MVAAPFRRTFLCSLAVLAAGCLNNPNKPAGDDGGAEGFDGALSTLDGPRSDTALTADARPDLATDLQTPVEPGPDGAVPEAGAPDLMPDLAPDLMTCTPACTEGAKRCGTGGGVQTCVLVAGCADWGAETTCGDNATCAGAAPAAACACKPAPSCNGPGTFCKDASNVGTCARDAFGCVSVTSTTTACPAGQLCGGAAPNGACGCSNTCSAAQVGTYCVDTKTVATCTATNGCFASSGSTVCLGRQSCQGAAGTAACKCPATGTTEGTGCPTVGVTLCEGNAVLTCTAEAITGCKYWAKTTDCATTAGGPYQCGMRGGAPACQCPDPSTTQIFVDPVAGRDTGAVVPNGANSPASCRYKTLTKALDSITTTRRRVVATTANPPVSFNQETFPLVVPANVIVDTADGTPTPANYVIVFNSNAATSAIQLAGGSILEGYTVQAATGNAAASAISCTTGAVTVRTVTIVGAASGSAATKPATGIAIGTAAADTCSGTLSNLNVRNFQTGVVVTTTATTTTITDSTLRDNGGGNVGAGLLIAEGKVTATDLTVNKSAAGTASWGVVLNPVNQTTPPSLTASNLTIADVTRTGLELLATSGMAIPAVTLTGGNIEAGGADPGVHLHVGTLSLTGTNIHDCGSDGLRVEGGTATIGAGTKLDGNGRDGLRLMGGNVVLGAATGTAVTLANNTENGINVDAPGSGTALAVNRVHVSGSGKTGVLIDFFSSAGGLASFKDSDINGNLDGVSIVRAAATAGDSVTLDNVRIFNNGRTGPGGVGVALRGGSANIAATVKNCAIHNNRDQGVVVRQGSSVITSLTLDANDIYANNTGAGQAVGGIFFATSSTLTAFTANKIHGNTGDEIGFDAQPNGGDTWDLSAPACGAATNQIYCYTAAGGTNVGLRILDTAPTSTKVNAANTSWSQLIPVKGTDFEFDMTKLFDVTATPACAAVVATCP